MAVVCGVDRLQAARVRAMDLRGGAALVIAGLQARGDVYKRQILTTFSGPVSISNAMLLPPASICRKMVAHSITSVSYTHLDVYKRQGSACVDVFCEGSGIDVELYVSEGFLPQALRAKLASKRTVKILGK